MVKSDIKATQNMKNKGQLNIKKNITKYGKMKMPHK